MSDEVRAAQQRSRAQYSTVAHGYATSASHAGGDDLAWFEARARSVVPTVALDVACGGGFSTRALLAAGHQVVSTDLTPESVAAARWAIDRGQVLWAAGAAEALPVATSSVGVVGCRIAPHHFGDMAAFVDEAARVLRPGGLFLLVDTTVPEDAELAGWLDEVERMRDPSHGRSWPASRWRAVCTGARLAVQEVVVTRKRHDLESWLARSGCAGAAADAVRQRFRSAPEAVVSAYSIERNGDDVLAYTDSKVCLRAVR